MADPVREKNLQNLADVVSTVKQSGGYEIDVRTVERVRRRGYQMHDYTAVNILEGVEKKQDGPGHLVTCFLPVYMEISVWKAEDLASEANKAMAAVMKAVMADPQRGGWATDTREVGSRMFLDEKDPARPIGGFRVELSIEYRHVRNNPYASM
jgi:hypothetical protein